MAFAPKHIHLEDINESDCENMFRYESAFICMHVLHIYVTIIILLLSRHNTFFTSDSRKVISTVLVEHCNFQKGMCAVKEQLP